MLILYKNEIQYYKKQSHYYHSLLIWVFNEQCYKQSFDLILILSSLVFKIIQQQTISSFIKQIKALNIVLIWFKVRTNLAFNACMLYSNNFISAAHIMFTYIKVG